MVAFVRFFLYPFSFDEFLTALGLVRSVAFQSGKKFTYNEVGSDVESAKIKEALELLVMAGVDYVIAPKGEIIPIEVKAGTKGAMQSLYRFIELKNSPKAIRTSMENFGKIGPVDIHPLYSIGNLMSK